MSPASRRAVLLAAAALGAAPAALPADEGISGTLHGPVTWSGEVRIAGDVEVAEDAALTIEAGTRVLLAREDAARGGWNPGTIEIHVKGDLRILGAPGKPVVFAVEGVDPPPASDPAEADADPAAAPDDSPGERPAVAERSPRGYPWHGIVLWPSGRKARARDVRGAIFPLAYAAIQVPKGRASVEGCVFVACGTGVEVGSAYVDGKRGGMRGGVARPAVVGCRFARCGAGVSAESEGAPSVTRCAFADCVYGVGNGRSTGWTYPLQEPGCTVIRCDFLRNGVGVLGPSIVASSQFVRNGTALAFSSFHTRHGTGTDFSAFTGNAFSGNRVDLSGECVRGEAVESAEPGYAASPDALLAALLSPAMPALPEELRLASGTAIRGTAADGGDPGCLGDPAPPPGEPSWTPAGIRLLRPLAAEVETPAAAAPPDPREPAYFGKLRPVPGGPLRRSWWCATAAGGDGTFALRWILRRPEGRSALAFRVECAQAGPADLEVNGDLREAEVWWNGEAVPGLPVPRRFEASGAVLRVVAIRGVNVLLLRLRGRGAGPRLGLSLRPPGAWVPAEADAPAPRPGRILRATVRRDAGKDGAAHLRVDLPDPICWNGHGTVRLLRADGTEIPPESAAARVDEPRVLRFGPLPEEALAGCGAVLLGFFAPDGAALEFPAAPFDVPAAPPAR